MSLHEKVIKELGYGMSMSDRKDIMFVATWVSRREDGSLTATMCSIEDEPITDELKQNIAGALRRLAESIEQSAQHSVEPTVYHSGDQPAVDNQSESEKPA
jgi:hypothetical protein